MKEVTFDHSAIADALVSLYFDTPGSFTLERASIRLGIPVSDLYGAVRKYYHALPRAADEGPMPPSKVCSRCRTTRTLEDFPSDRTRPGGKDNKCKPCRREMQKRYRRRRVA